MHQTILELNGETLSVEDVFKVAYEKQEIAINEDCYNRLIEARRVVYELADEGLPIYGFTVGVGWNKDKRVFGKYFEDYNRNLIYAHCVAAEPYATEEQVRAVMLARLNGFLAGRTGIQPEIAKQYCAFLNHGIHPMLPLRGSIGQADIANLSHIGLAIMGEGEVFYEGQRMETQEALKKAGLEPLVLGPKDGLAIVSSNALAAGLGALVLKKVKDLVKLSDLVYAISLEGFDGNVTPLNKTVNALRKMKGQIQSADAVRAYLEGSFLMSKEITKSVQDPLSYRDAIAVHGAVSDAIRYVEEHLQVHLNTTDDNPCVITEERKIISCCNFEVTNWVIGFEMLGIALSHLSKMACYRTIKMSDPSFTKLPRFLSPSEGDVAAYQTIQKPFVALDAEIRHLANPSTMDSMAVAGGIEDHANNSPYVVRKVDQIVDNLYYILGIELLHAAQAIDLRKPERLGKATSVLYKEFRKEVSFLEKDRNLTLDIQKAYDFLKSKETIQLADVMANDLK